ncbi:SGNH/GDSL hydrolase family protein [Massilia antarctica]|uniref:SGNH/GDSL hydrolase family protein n=1 Tax=Massilia antarctica TaxID=2765360 RepID=A0AA49A9N0_9BURK|nr:SGNH/GDSL hydrolase family protein [Massilia antarctica]QPI50942.1 SGNH/GDSL hydrolase family protein [Massilia antarctica]
MKHFLNALLLSLTFSTSAHGAENAHWSAAWTAVPDSPGPALTAQTIRQVVRTSIAGSKVRIRLSNLYGTTPVTLGPVHLGAHAGGAQVQAGTDHPLTFAGKQTVTIATGDSVLSDSVDMQVPALRNLVVSIYLPQQIGVSTIHGAGMQTAFMTTAGDLTAAQSFSAEQTDDSRYFLTDVEVLPALASRTFVVLGDSITDGIGSANDSNARWTDALATRLQGDPRLASIAVVNAGIAGNRLLNDAAEPFVGPSALSRFKRDVLDKPGVHWVLVHEGINDITAAQMLTAAKDQVSAAQIIGGMQTMTARARKNGVKVWGGTLLPFEGTQRFYSEAAEAKRQAVNAWIRSPGAFDAVVDFDLALRDPVHPGRLQPDFDSGDHLHPNEAGYRMMANASDLRLLVAQPQPSDGGRKTIPAGSAAGR